MKKLGIACRLLVVGVSMATGQVAGEAAAYAVKEGRDLWKEPSALATSDLPILRKRLEDSGAIVPDKQSPGMIIIIANAQQAQ